MHSRCRFLSVSYGMSKTTLQLGPNGDERTEGLKKRFPGSNRLFDSLVVPARSEEERAVFRVN